MRDWISCAMSLPPFDLVVETMDSNGQTRRLKMLQRPNCVALWWLPDGSTYVYFTPAYWREVDPSTQTGETK